MRRSGGCRLALVLTILVAALIGNDFKPFYGWMKGQDLGVKSWPPDA